jgi:hypothetical protein
MSSDPYESLFSSLLPNLFGNRDKYEPVAPLSKEEAKEWDDIQNEMGRIKCLIRETEARKSLFWASIEKKLKLYDHDLRIENGMVMEKVKEKKGCDHVGTPQPGFCNGECADCALNPNNNEDDD